MAGDAVQVGDGRVLGVGRAVGPAGLGLLVDGVDLLDVEEGQQVAIDVAQGERLALGDALAGLNRQDHGQGPERAVGQPHLGDDPLVVGLAEEAAERREGAGGEQFEVAEGPLVERQAGVVLGRRLHLGGSGVIDDQVDQGTAIRGVQARLGRGARGRNRRAPFGNRRVSQRGPNRVGPRHPKS